MPSARCPISSCLPDHNPQRTMPEALVKILREIR